MSTSTLPTSSNRALFPFTEQEPFLRTDHRYYGYVSGVGAGKTFAGMLRTAYNMERWNDGEMGAIVAPTTTMVKDVILPLMRESGLMDRWEYKSMHTDEPGIHAPNGSRALILSADNRKTTERLAGLNLAWFWLDEASRVNERAFEILTQRLRVGDYQNGFITTTPMGRNYVYDFFVDDLDGSDYQHGEADVHEHGIGDRLAILRVPTYANPFTDDTYKADMEAKEGQTYEREILGRFVDYEGLVYGWFDLDKHIEPDPSTKGVRQHIYGVDWGHNNPSVVLAIGVRNDGAYVVRDEFYESRHTVNDLVDVIERFYDRYGRGRVFCDPAEPASIDTLQRSNIDATGGINDLMPGIQQVTSNRDDLVIADHCRNLIDEFGMYRYSDTGESEKPVDANNHALDALRYAIMTYEKHGELSVGVAFG